MREFPSHYGVTYYNLYTSCNGLWKGNKHSNSLIKLLKNTAYIIISEEILSGRAVMEIHRYKQLWIQWYICLHFHILEDATVIY